MFSHGLGVGVVTLHPQRQRFDALEEEERVKGRECGAGVAQQHGANTADVGRRSERVGPDNAVVAGVRPDEDLELLRLRAPVEVAGIDHDAADRGAVAADELRQRVDDDVDALIEEPRADRRRDRVVNDQRHADAVGGLGPSWNVEHVEARVADRLAEDGLRSLVGCCCYRGRVTGVDPANFDPVLRQRVGEQVVGAAVDLANGDDVVAGLGDVEDRVGDGSLAGCDCDGADAAFEVGQALFEHARSRVHDPRVDVAGNCQREEIGRVLGVIEDVGGRLVDRDGARVGRRIWLLASVEGDCFWALSWL